MSNRITLRRAAEEDQRAINRLIREGGINPLGTHWSRFVVALDENGTPVGCGQVKAHRDGSRELASLAVSRTWRRRGVAGGIVGRLKQIHGQPLWLTCIDRLVPFYERQAFERITNPRQMPTYFRRASRLFNLYLLLTRGKGELAVMVWDGRKDEKFDQSGVYEIS